MCLGIKIAVAFTSPLFLIRARPVSTFYFCLYKLKCALHGLINHIDSKAVCGHLKNGPVKRLCGSCLSVCGPLPPVGFCLEWCSNFLGSESGQIQSVKLLKNMVSNTTQQQSPPPIQTLSAFTIFDTGRGGGES